MTSPTARPRPPTPSRIVSLVPSTTETLFDLGAGDRVVGVTRFCVRPDLARRLPKVGGTKDVDVQHVLALKPDLVLANREENLPDPISSLQSSTRVHVAQPGTVDQALDEIRTLAGLLNLPTPAISWVASIQDHLRDLKPWTERPLTVVAYIWRDPWMACGGDTFASDLLARAGLRNLIADQRRYPEVPPERLASLRPDLILLPSEPFPFRARHAEELATLSGLPLDRFQAMDGEHLTWHGTRLARALPALLAARRHGFPPLPRSTSDAP